jgi:hypothetical protein
MLREPSTPNRAFFAKNREKTIENRKKTIENRQPFADDSPRTNEIPESDFSSSWLLILNRRLLFLNSSLLVMNRKSTADYSESFAMKSQLLFFDRKRTILNPPRAADD